MIASTSLLARILSRRAFSTLRILPRIGRMACVFGSRPPRAEPPAESPSTMNTSQSPGLRDWQSTSLPGKPPPPRRPLRLRAMSRALRAAIRASAAACDLRMMSLPSEGLRSNQSPNRSLRTFCTNDLASVLPSLVLVWPSNWGSASLMEMMAVRPSRMSSPETRSSFFFTRPQVSPQRLTVLVRAARNPSSWVPPSWVLMVLAKVCTELA